jgi:glycosyltransferase involved in cell wall biosynthesis
VAERGWQRTLSQAAQIFCATAPHAAQMQEKFSRAQVKELPVIVEPPPGLELSSRRRRAGEGAGKPLSLLFVANLVPNKNPHVFVETLQRLRAAGWNATGTVLGDGPERASLETFCRQAGMELAVCFRGKVPNTEVYAALADADFLLSASNGEPYGRGIAEAMSVGTPAICHRSGGPADFIDDGKDGLLADALTAEAYAARLEAALSQPDAWNRLSAAALRKAQQWRTGIVLDMLEAQLQQMAEGSSKKT